MDESRFPDVKSYLSVYLFLQDYFKARKNLATTKFSYQAWADELEFKSRGYLRLAIYGKRKISEELAQKLSQSLPFDNVDREYFLLLVLYTQASQTEQKKFFGKKLITFLKAESSFSEVEPPEEILADPLYLVIRAILSFSDIPKTLSYLAGLMNLEEGAMLHALNQLKVAGLVEEENEIWKCCQDSVEIPTMPGSRSLREYHKKSLLKALQAQELPSDQRSYRSLNIALGAEEYQEYLQDLYEFSKKVFAKYNGSALKEKRLYQINYNVFPWTKNVT